MYLEHLSQEEIIGLNLATGIPLVYKLDDTLSVLEKQFLGNPDVIAAKMMKVANQGKKSIESSV